MSKTIEAPCLNCPVRYIGCHANCDEFLAYQYDLEQVKKEKKNKELTRSYSHSYGYGTTLQG